MVLISQQIEYIDNSSSDDTLEYSRLIANNTIVPSGLWLETGSMTMKTRIRIQCADFGNENRGARFHNPTTQQWGYLSLLCEGYTQRQDRIQFEKQEITTEHPVVDIFNCRNSVPLTIAKDVTSGSDHLFSVSSIQACIKLEGEVPPAPIPSILYGEAVIGDGAVCLRGFPGREAYTGTESWPPGTVHQFELDRRQLGWFDEIRGLCYPRTTITITIEVVSDTVANEAPPPIINPIINNDAPFPVYSYGCALGFPIPSLTNPPCDPASQIVKYNPQNQTFYSSCAPATPVP